MFLSIIWSVTVLSLPEPTGYILFKNYKNKIAYVINYYNDLFLLCSRRKVHSKVLQETNFFLSGLAIIHDMKLFTVKKRAPLMIVIIFILANAEVWYDQKTILRAEHVD